MDLLGITDILIEQIHIEIKIIFDSPLKHRIIF